jgi:hypothetical protein
VLSRVYNWWFLSYLGFVSSAASSKSGEITASGQAWAAWINTNIFHFVLFGRTYGAADILPFDVLGYALLIVASWLFSRRCPPMLAQSKRPDLGDPEATPFEFAHTVQKVGSDIPTRDFFLTLNGLLGRNASVIDSLPALEKKRIDERFRDMERAVDTDNRQSFVGYDIEFAQLLPQQIGKDIYVTGRNLFNITRWRSRVTIIVLSVLSALFAGLPVLYHLVWMVFPNIERTI